MHEKQACELEEEGVKYCGFSMLGITKKMKKCASRLGLSYSEDKKKQRKCDKRLQEEQYGNASAESEGEKMQKGENDWKRSHDSGLCSEDSYSSPPGLCYEDSYSSPPFHSSSHSTLAGLIRHPKHSISRTTLAGHPNANQTTTSDLDSSKYSSHDGTPIPTPAISAITTITRSNFNPSSVQTKPKKSVQYTRNADLSCSRSGPHRVRMLPPALPFSSTTTPQWNHLYQSALAQVHLRVPSCHLHTTRLVFSHSTTKLKKSLSNLTTSQIGNVIFSIREILYANWFIYDHICFQPVEYLDLILFCVQRFMILVCDEIRDISPQMYDFLQLFEDLQLKCLKNKFCDIEFHLEETRKLYIDVWCFLISSF